jgi:hypothetical protein
VIALTGAGCGAPGGGSTPATTWSTTDKTSGLTLSNANRTVTHIAGGNTVEGIRSIASTAANQKVYLEHVVGAVTTNWSFGFAVIGANLANGNNLDSISPSLAVGFSTSNGVYKDADNGVGAFVAVAALIAGDRLGIAFNTQTLLIWGRKNGGLWMPAIGGAQDPAAGTGGLGVVMTGSPYFAWCGMDANNGDNWTTNFASSDWVDAAPSGYTQLQ